MVRQFGYPGTVLAQENLYVLALPECGVTTSVAFCMLSLLGCSRSAPALELAPWCAKSFPLVGLDRIGIFSESGLVAPASFHARLTVPGFEQLPAFSHKNRVHD